MKTLKYKLPKIIGIVLLLFAFVAAKAQPANFIVLSKPGKKKRYTFIEGQEITYKLKNDIGFFTDKIVKIKDSVLEFATYSVAYTDIDKIHINKKKYILSYKTILTYGVNLIGSTAILQLAYLVNTGAGLTNLGPTLLYLAAPIPAFLLANWVYSWFVKTEYSLSPNDYQFRPVILRKD